MPNVIKKSSTLFREVFNIPKNQPLNVRWYIRGEHVFFVCDQSPLIIQVSDYVSFGKFRKYNPGWSFMLSRTRGAEYDHFPSHTRGGYDHFWSMDEYRRAVWDENGMSEIRLLRKDPYPKLLDEEQMHTYICNVWSKIAVPICSLEYLDLSRGNRFTTRYFGGFRDFQVLPKSSMPKIMLPGFPLETPNNFKSWMRGEYPDIESVDYPQIYLLFVRYRARCGLYGSTAKEGLYDICAILFQKGVFLKDIVFLDDIYKGMMKGPTDLSLMVLKRIAPHIKTKRFWKSQFRAYQLFRLGMEDSKSTVHMLNLDVIDMHIKPFLFPKRVMRNRSTT